MLGKLNHYVTRVGILLIAAALIAGMVGCYRHPPCPTPAPSQNLEIRTWYDLDAVRSNLEGNHTLMNNLDSAALGYEELASPTANEGKGWEPIGTFIPMCPYGGFAGTFDGQGCEIRDLYIDRPDESLVGLFGCVREAGLIKDTAMTNITVIGNWAVGGLVGRNTRGTVTNCYAVGSIGGDSPVGGLVGYNQGPVTNCYATGSVIAGGVAGNVSAVVGGFGVGGLVGLHEEGSVRNCYFTGSVTSNFSCDEWKFVVGVGGLVGVNYDTLSDCYSNANVTGEYGVGGLVGRDSYGTITDCYFTGSVTGNSEIGGLVASNEGAGSLTNSFYNYDEVLINGENVITVGALFDKDFEEWMANGKFLDANERLSQEDGYYLINDVSDFRELLAFGQDSSLKFGLKDDLDLGDETNFYVPYFAGEFDGDSHRISNLSLNSDLVSPLGLFGYLATGGKVTDVGLENINVTGYSGVGGLVGDTQEGTVSQCYSTGAVTGNDIVGGLVGGSNFGIVTGSYSTANVTGYSVVGGLIGGNHGSVDKSYSTGSVTGNSHVGGLVGSNLRDVSNSYSSGRVTGDEQVGGLVGYNNGTVSDSHSTGSVSGEGNVGGLVGINYFGSVSNSYFNYDEALINGEKVVTIGALFGEDFEQWLANDRLLDVNGRLPQEEGYYLINDVDDLKQLMAFGQNDSLKFRLTSNLDLSGEPDLYIPYLAGEFDGNGHKISNLRFSFDCVSHVGLFGYLAPGGRITQVGVENVDISGCSYVGGLLGWNGYYGLEDTKGIVSNSYSTGRVTGKGSYVGGLVGYSLGTVSDCYSACGLTGDEYVGGLVGYSEGTVSNSYSTGSVTGSRYVGGLVGSGGLTWRTVSNCFWDRQTSGQSTSDGGKSKSTAQMKNISTFSGAGWNIVAVSGLGQRNPAYIWNIVNGVTYPCLSWQPV